MKTIRNFDDLLELGIVKKVSPDIRRARGLKIDSKKRKKFVEEMIEKLEITDENANYFIENTYNVLIEVIRAQMFIRGYKAVEENADEAEVAYLRKLRFPEKQVIYMISLRYCVNSIQYLGKKFEKGYAWKVINFMNELYPKLMQES